MAQKATTEQSACFVFHGNTVATFNEEVAVRAALPEGLSLAGAVPAKSLMDQLAKWPDESIDVERGDGVLTVKGNRREAEIRMEAEVTLPVGRVPLPDAWVPLDVAVMEAIEVVSTCARLDGSHFALGCVHITPTHIEACDNFQISRFTCQLPVEGSFLIRAAVLAAVAKLGPTHIAIGGDWLHLRRDTVVYSVRRYIEEYPDLSGAMAPDGAVPVTLPAGLGEAATRAEVFSRENTEDNKVTVELRPGGLRVSGTGATGRFRETKDVGYTGPNMAFLISPTLLQRIIDRQVDVLVSEKKLLVTSGALQYVASVKRQGS